MQNISKKITYFPLKILLSFLVFTEVLFFVGPIEYKIDYPSLLIFYILILNFALYFGYKYGVATYKPSIKRDSLIIVRLIILCAVPLEFIKLISTWGVFDGISINEIIGKVYQGLANPGEAFYGRLEETTALGYFTIFASPITFSAIPLGVYTWNKLPRLYRIFTSLIIIIEMCTWLGIGTRKGLMDLILIVIFAFIAKKPNIIENKKSIQKLKLYVGIILLIFLFYFTFSILSRFGKDSFAALQYMGSDNIKAFYSDNFSPFFYVPLEYIHAYLCQGYYSLSRALSIGIIPLAPMAMSWFTISIAAKFGYNVIPNTYMYLLEAKDNIDMSANWHTIYVWLANDFSFLGVPFVIFIIGFYFSRTWLDSINGKDLISIPLNSLFIIMIFYFFANNQVLSFSFIPFITIFGIYILKLKLGIPLRTV